MLYYLFSIDQEAKRPLPFKIELFKYYPIETPLYYVVQIDKEKIEILDSNNKIYMQGVLAQKTKEKKETNLQFNLSGAMAGGVFIITQNMAELIIYGSGLPFINAYKGNLRKLIKKN